MGYISDIRKKVGHDPVFMPSAGCAIIQNNKVLLQKREDNGKWALHGGALDLGETFEEALIREVKEELNVTVLNPELIDIYSGKEFHMIYPNQDEVYGICAVYLVREFIGQLKQDDSEVTELRWFELDDIPKDMHKPDKKAIIEIIKRYMGK